MHGCTESACTTPEGTFYTDDGVVVAYGIVPQRSPVLLLCSSTYLLGILVLL